jgi:hypothetical protein
MSIVISISGVYQPQTGQKAIKEDMKHIKPNIEATGISLGAITSISSKLGRANEAYIVIEVKIPKDTREIPKNNELIFSLSHITWKKFE